MELGEGGGHLNSIRSVSLREDQWNWGPPTPISLLVGGMKNPMSPKPPRHGASWLNLENVSLVMAESC